MDKRFARTSLLTGAEGINKLGGATVAVFGLGGVGGYVCEALARSGVGKFILCDGDKVDITNINRQIIALDSTVGMLKTEVMKNRIGDINPRARVLTFSEFYSDDTYDRLDLSGADYIADAIDDIKAKLLLAKTAQENGIPIISAMGAGNKLDPTGFEVSDIFKTSVCPIARIMRRELKKLNISKLKAVYSKEIPQAPKFNLENEKTVGSLACTVPVMGLIMASEIIKDILDS